MNPPAPTIPGVLPDQGFSEWQLLQELAAIWEEAGQEETRTTPPHRVTCSVSPEFQGDQQGLPVRQRQTRACSPSLPNQPQEPLPTHPNSEKQNQMAEDGEIQDND